MKHWELLDSQPIPGTNSYMRLMRHDTELVIHVDDRELMSTRMHGSEDALSDLACDHLEQFPEALGEARVLIGGLGIGFTLAAALRRVGPEAAVVVAEVVPAVIQWNRSLLGETAGHPVNDPRASIHQGDVADLIRTPPHPWDAILLDVDNGPNALTRKTNDWLYSREGLIAARAALSSHGVLNIWSAAPDDRFTRRLGHAGFKTDPVMVRARGSKGGRRHIVWVSTPDPSWQQYKATTPEGKSSFKR